MFLDVSISTAALRLSITTRLSKNTRSRPPATTFKPPDGKPASRAVCKVRDPCLQSSRCWRIQCASVVSDLSSSELMSSNSCGLNMLMPRVLLALPASPPASYSLIFFIAYDLTASRSCSSTLSAVKTQSTIRLISPFISGSGLSASKVLHAIADTCFPPLRGRGQHPGRQHALRHWPALSFGRCPGPPQISPRRSGSRPCRRAAARAGSGRAAWPARCSCRSRP